MKKHARPGVDAERAHIGGSIGLLDLAWRQRNAIDPQRLVACLER